jgi:hypothetical protein
VTTDYGHEMDPVRMLCKWCHCGGGPAPAGPCPGRVQRITAAQQQRITDLETELATLRARLP